MYGEQHPNGEQLNLRGKVCLHLDQSGSATVAAADFKGNVLTATRRLTDGGSTDSKGDWSTAGTGRSRPTPERRSIRSRSTQLSARGSKRKLSEQHDLRRAEQHRSQSIAPHSAGDAPEQRHPAGRSTRPICWSGSTWLNLRGARQPARPGDPIWHVVRRQHRLRRQGPAPADRLQERREHSYDYDPLTFRLAQPRSRGATPRASRRRSPRPADLPAGAGCGVQNLHYTYDPAGNITHIQDDAQQTIYFRNKRVEPSNDYTYDALYRLIAGDRPRTPRSGRRRAQSRTPTHDAPRVGMSGTATERPQSDGHVHRNATCTTPSATSTQMRHHGGRPGQCGLDALRTSTPKPA